MNSDVLQTYEKEQIDYKRQKLEEVYKKEFNKPQSQLKFFENTKCCNNCTTQNLLSAVEHGRKDIVEKILEADIHGSISVRGK